MKFVGSLRNTIGKGRVKLKINGADKTIRDLIGIIVEEFPQAKRALIDPELEDPRPNALIIVNGKEISVLNGLETILKDEDEVVFVPVSHGG